MMACVKGGDPEMRLPPVQQPAGQLAVRGRASANDLEKNAFLSTVGDRRCISAGGRQNLPERCGRICLFGEKTS